MQVFKSLSHQAEWGQQRSGSNGGKKKIKNHQVSKYGIKQGQIKKFRSMYFVPST